ncbi:MAG: phospholipase A [Bacteroidales bacterium]|nr:phospholipase A [Bacteroidales bacterium]
MKRFLSFLFVVFLAAGYACAQDPAAIPDDSFYEQTQRQRFPVFGMFKETYFVTGIPANTSSIDKHNADVRFQVSLALRVARIDNVDILGTYTETGVWHVYDTSSPLVENAFNPGLCVYWYVNPKLDMMFGGDHMSNGYINERSRSVNKAFVGAIYSPDEHLSLGGKVWYGYYEHIPGLTHYFIRRGYMAAWATYKAFGNRLNFTALVNPSNKFKNYNLEFNLSYRLSDKGNLPACRFRPVPQRLLRNSAEFQQVRVSLQGRVLSGAQAWI